MALMGAVFTSCSKDIAFDNEAVAQQQIAEYQANFVKKYGPVDPNQTWDFSDPTPVSYLAGGSVNTRSAASGPITVTRSEDKMTIDNTFLTWMHDNMGAGSDNTTHGDPFKLTIPDHSFTITPIFQGLASYYWELWMHIGTTGDGAEQIDVKIWSKGDNLKYRVQGNTTWLEAGTGDQGTKNAVEVEAPTFTFNFDGASVGRSMFFYMKTWANKKTFDADVTGTNYNIMSSVDKQMLALKVPAEDIPACIPSDHKDILIIGCEDSPYQGGIDKDFEDLVILTDGLEMSKVDYVERVIAKRYLIEDLGASDDFDFNDIVVDMQDVWLEKIIYEDTPNGGWKPVSTEVVENTRHQRAIVRAMGGTIDFALKIGGTEIFKKSDLTDYAVTDMLNTGWNNTPINRYAQYAVINNCELNEDGTVKDGTKKWELNDNNISVYVENIGNNGEILSNEVKFPKQGEIPMIIATSTGKLGSLEFWMKERQSIPTDWFTLPTQQ